MVARLRQRSQSALPETNPAELANCGLPTSVVDRLADAGICTAADWQALSRKLKNSFWGVTRRSIELIDKAVAGNTTRAGR
jgi:hypothetical protein